MRYQPLPPAFHAGRRRALRDQLEPGTLAIIDTNSQLTRSRDTHMPFRPDSYFYYLTGIDQPEAVLVLSRSDERLFIRETNEQMRIWDGEAYTRGQAAKLSAIGHVEWNQGLERYLKMILPDIKTVLCNYSGTPDNSESAGGAARALKLSAAYPDVEVRPVRHLAELRLTKQPEEIAQIRRAVELTAAGFDRARELLTTGRLEYEIEAEFTHTFMRGGASGHAYEPIIASGQNSTVLHYISNDQPLRSGGLVVMDVGAEYGWYAADITRTWPVGGSFTARQREVYDAVLSVQRAAIKQMKPGVTLVDIERQVGHLMVEALINLGVMTADESKANPQRYREFYPHAVSHFLGLDVHDVGDPSRPLEAGMVLTCEPGIYLKDEAIGVRLEDDILITPRGNENLSAVIPIDPS